MKEQGEVSGVHKNGGQIRLVQQTDTVYQVIGPDRCPSPLVECIPYQKTTVGNPNNPQYGMIVVGTPQSNAVGRINISAFCNTGETACWDNFTTAFGPTFNPEGKYAGIKAENNNVTAEGNLTGSFYINYEFAQCELPQNAGTLCTKIAGNEVNTGILLDTYNRPGTVQEIKIGGGMELVSQGLMVIALLSTIPFTMWVVASASEFLGRSGESAIGGVQAGIERGRNLVKNTRENIKRRREGMRSGFSQWLRGDAAGY